VSVLTDEGFEAPRVDLRGGAEGDRWRPAELPMAIAADRIDLKLEAARDPVTVGTPFQSDLRDTWVRSAPPEKQKVEYTFVAPSGVRHHVDARYAGDYRWQVEFTPTEIGRWRYYFRHQFEDPYKSSEGFFDAMPGDRADVERQLRELLAEVRAAWPKVEKGQQTEVVHQFGERFWRLERAAMQLETPESFRSEVGRTTFALITEVRQAMSGRRVPDEPDLEGMDREW
jgi:hypothetical protein